MTLSIVTINYNNIEGLRKTIDSVLSQTWHDFEWIIIDGGSTDGSKELIEETANKLTDSDFNPLSYWCSEPDKGIYNAMNKGIKHCNGEYLNFMNSGDTFYKCNTTETVFSTQYTEDVLYGDVYFQNGEEKYFHKLPENITLLNYLRKDFINHQSCFIRRERQLQHMYDESFKISADTDFFMFSLTQGAKFRYLNIPIAIYALGGLSSSNLSLCHQDENLAITKNIVEQFLPWEFISFFNFYRKNNFNKKMIHLLIKIGKIINTH